MVTATHATHTTHATPTESKTTQHAGTGANPCLHLVMTFAAPQHPSALGACPDDPLDAGPEWTPFDFALSRFLHATGEDERLVGVGFWGGRFKFNTINATTPTQLQQTTRQLHTNYNTPTTTNNALTTTNNALTTTNNALTTPQLQRANYNIPTTTRQLQHANYAHQLRTTTHNHTQPHTTNRTRLRAQRRLQAHPPLRQRVVAALPDGRHDAGHTRAQAANDVLRADGPVRGAARAVRTGDLDWVFWTVVGRAGGCRDPHHIAFRFPRRRRRPKRTRRPDQRADAVKNKHPPPPITRPQKHDTSPYHTTTLPNQLHKLNAPSLYTVPTTHNPIKHTATSRSTSTSPPTRPSATSSPWCRARRARWSSTTPTC